MPFRLISSHWLSLRALDLFAAATLFIRTRTLCWRLAGLQRTMLTSAPLAMRTAIRAARSLRASVIALPRRWACAPAAAAPVRCFAAASAPPASSSSSAPPSHSVVPTSALAAGEIGDFEPDDPTVFFHTLPELTPPVQRLMAGYSHPVPVHVVWGEQDKFGRE